MDEENSAQSGSGNGEPDYSQPVAYDTQGRPLYLRPPEAGPGAESGAGVPAPDSHTAEAVGAAAAAQTVEQANPQYVHVSRPLAPAQAEVPQDIMAKAEASRRQYPHLNLSQGEYVIAAVRRHPIGLVNIWGAAILVVLALGGSMAAFISGNSDQGNMMLLATAALALVAFFALGAALIGSHIYNANRFYLTNESVIQEIQIGLFNKHVQTVSLESVEDVSYYQNGILPHMFNYGLVRLSTVGDETTYRFSYASEPEHIAGMMNNAVEAFKNGRPVELPRHGLNTQHD